MQGARVAAAATARALRLVAAWLRRVGPLLRPSAIWRRLSASQQLIAKNILVGILIAVAIHRWNHITPVVGLQDAAMDVMMQVSQNLPRMRPAILGGAPIGYTFLDIDEDTYRTWGEPLYTPRDKLLRLIQFAADGGAAVLVVDVDLSRRGFNAEHDAALTAFLQKRASRKEGTPIVLMRSFHPRADRTTVEFTSEVRRSFLDEYLEWTAMPWAQPLFRRTVSDGIVRYWQMIAPACLNGRPVVVPSAQLVAFIGLLKWRGDDAAASAARSAVSALAPAACDKSAATLMPVNKTLQLGPHRIQLGQDAGIGERIIYTVSWNPGQVPDLLSVPARLVTESTAPLSSEAVAGRVVVIGASYADSGDLHQTPLGLMPGALIIVNATKSLASFGQIAEPPTVVRWAVELVLIVGTALAFSRLGSVLGTLTSTIAIVALLVPLSFYFFKFGVWVDFAVPLLAMSLHLILESFEKKDHHPPPGETSATGPGGQRG